MKLGKIYVAIGITVLGLCFSANGMASKEKVQAFLKESDSHKHYSQIIDLSLTYFITRAEKDGETP